MAKNVHSYNIIPLYDIGSETWPLWKTGIRNTLKVWKCRAVER